MLDVIMSACDAANWTLRDGQVFVPLPEGRHQVLRVRQLDEDGEALVRVDTPIAPTDVLNETRLRAALRLNAQMRHGAIAVLGAEVVLCDTFLVSHATTEEVRASMRYLALRADDYEHAIMHADDR